MGCLAPGEMFDNLLQLMRFSVYFEGVLNKNKGYFHIKIMISATHMLGGLWARSLRGSLGKNAFWLFFYVSLHTILGPPNQFLCMLYAAPSLRSVS